VLLQDLVIEGLRFLDSGRHYINMKCLYQRIMVAELKIIYIIVATIRCGIMANIYKSKRKEGFADIAGGKSSTDDRPA